MAQTNYTPISLYYSTTASAAPTSGNLVNGELAINITDGKLYFKNNSGTVTLLASAAGASGDVVGPSSATDNALVRFDTTTGKLVQNSVGILSDAGVLTGLTGLTSSGNVTLSALTSGRVTYASTGGLLVDSANMTFNGTTLTVAGLSNTGNTILGDASADTVTVNGTITSNLIFTDNTYDIGASGATRPRNIYTSGTGIFGGTLFTQSLAIGNARIQIRDNSIEEYAANAQSNVVVNYNGYQGGTTQFRDFDIYNGKNGFIATFEGSTSRVGIGNTNPAYTLDVSGTGNFTGNLNGTSMTLNSYASIGSLVSNDPGAAYYSYTNRIGGSVGTSGIIGIGVQYSYVPSSITLTVGGSAVFGVTSTTTGDCLSSGGGNSTTYNGVALLSNSRGTSTQANTGLPSWIVDVGGRAADGVTYNVNTQNTFRVAYVSAGGSYYSASEYFRIQSNGNAGFGVVPSTSFNQRTVVQVGPTMSIAGGNAYYPWQGYVGNNFYYDSSDVPKYLQSSGAALIAINAHNPGNIEMYTADAGTAGNTVSFTRVFALYKGYTLALQAGTQTSGTGIAFPATQNGSANANTLDDYEEGSWTPSVQFGGGSTGVTYTYRTGTYVKIGRQVTVWVTFYLSNKGSSTGDFSIGGLPYQPDQTFYNEEYGTAGEINNLTFSGYLAARVGGAASISVFQFTSGAAQTILSNTNFTNGTSMACTVTYTTNA